MASYDVTISYADFDVEDLDLVEAVATALPDLDIWCVDGQTRVRAALEATSATAAVEYLAQALHRAAPQVEPDRVELSLVSISDLAQSLGLSREAVRLWTIGKRGPGGFPQPVDTLVDRVKVWSAGEVWLWLNRYSLPHADARPLLMHEVVDGTRAIERIRRCWRSEPLLVSVNDWHYASREEAQVPVLSAGTRAASF